MSRKPTRGSTYQAGRLSKVLVAKWLKSVWKRFGGYLPLTMIIVLMAMLAAPAFGAYSYYVPIEVFNNSTTSYTNLPILVSINNTQLYTQGYINATALDTDVQEGAGIPYSVANNKLGLYAASLTGNQERDYTYYLGYSPAQSDYPLIVGVGGNVTRADTPALELGNNFTVEQKGYVDTSAGSNKNLVYKQGAFRTYISAGQNITAAISSYSSTYPTVAAVNGGNIVTDNTTHYVALPVGIASGNLLLVLFASDANPAITFPGGWTLLFQDHNATSAIELGAWYRIADGTEASPITVTTNSGQMSAHSSYRITGYSGVPEVGTSDKGTSANPDPPSLTPSWGSQATLWVAGCGYDVGTVTVSNYPTNYADNQRNDRSNNAGGVGAGIASRNLTATSEDPLTFTISASEPYVANTIAIAPFFSELKTVTATGITSGVRKVITTAVPAGNLTISVYDQNDALIDDDTVALAGATTYNNNNAWYFAQFYNVMPYMDYLKFTTASGFQLWYQPVTIVNGTTATDRSGAGNHGTINWGANPAGIEVTISGATSPTAYTASAEEGVLPDVLPLPTGFDVTATNVTGVATLWQYDLINRAANSLGWTPQTMYVVVGLLAATGIGFGALIGTGNMLGFAIGFGATAGLFASTGVMPWWIIVITISVVAMGIYTWRRG